ncbi:hypothetical protein C9374_002359 [Naegleria lovaniensis]|uniref:Uncharacterized protein n=1 Tax=Naegleria lovaniensis TaxID=51637 RepID=A0AA88GPM1_NAELO|nr:uncharacterized protein C9374_002359 [Naegleria lovaniensis]KAG2386615.1 hypothetical protein C9374_002359 [Naegleria lovaniensis]
MSLSSSFSSQQDGDSSTSSSAHSPSPTIQPPKLFSIPSPSSIKKPMDNNTRSSSSELILETQVLKKNDQILCDPVGAYGQPPLSDSSEAMNNKYTTTRTTSDKKCSDVAILEPSPNPLNVNSWNASSRVAKPLDKDSLDERRKTLQKELSSLPPQDLLASALYHLEHPPQVFVKGTDLFERMDTEQGQLTFGSSLESVISNVYTERATSSKCIAQSIIESSSLIYESHQASLIANLRTLLDTDRIESDDEECMDHEVKQVIQDIESACLCCPSLLPNIIPHNETTQILNFKDEGFLFRIVEEIISTGSSISLSEATCRVRFLQTLQEKLRIEYQCYSSHPRCVDRKVIRDAVLALTIVFSSINISRELVSFGILDLLVEFLRFEKRDEEYLKFVGFILQFMNDVVERVDQSRHLLHWILHGKGILVLIQKLRCALEYVEQSNVILLNKDQQETDHSLIAQYDSFIAKKIIKMLMTLSSCGRLQIYCSQALEQGHYCSEVKMLPKLLIKSISLFDSLKLILLKLLANLTDIPRLSNVILEELSFIPILLRNMKDNRSFMTCFYIFLQICQHPSIESSHINYLLWSLILMMCSDELLEHLMSFAMEINRVLQKQSEPETALPLTRNFVQIFSSTFSEIMNEFPEPMVFLSFVTNPNDENCCLAFIEMLSAEANIAVIESLKYDLTNKIDRVLLEEESKYSDCK